MMPLYNMGDDKLKAEFDMNRGVLNFFGSCTKIWSYLYFDGKRVSVLPPSFIDKNLFVSPLEKFISPGPLKVHDYALDLLFVIRDDIKTVDRGDRVEDHNLMRLLEKANEWKDDRRQLCEKFFTEWVLTRPPYLSSFEAFFGIKDIPSKLPFNNEGGVFVDVSSHGAWQKRVQKVEEITKRGPIEK